MLTLRQLEGCRAYASANRSDPFAMRRAISHTLNGLTFPGRSTLIHGENGKGMIQTHHEGDAGYTAKPVNVQKKDKKGNEYFVTEFHNVQRP